MALLTAARRRGLPDPVNMATDKAVDPSACAPDFQLLMLDLAFPDKPFAR